MGLRPFSQAAALCAACPQNKMMKNILTVLFTGAVIALFETSSPADVRAGSQIPSASGTSSPPQTTTSSANPEQIKSRLVALIRLNGYKCDTLTKWHPMLFSRGYEVYCDLYYSYDVEDKGGHWIVTVK
jgi:hypothetical protein